MSGHTPGPLSIGGTFMPNSDDPRENVWSPIPLGMQSGTQVASNMKPADAERMVACWNACEGINPEWVPNLLEALRKLTAEVSGLSVFEDEIRDLISNTNWNVLQLRLTEARAVIASATTPGE